MSRITSLLMTTLLFTGAAAAHAPQTELPCTTDEYRQFDSWVGDWVVTTLDGNRAGENKIRPILNGCVLLEKWHGARGSMGKSFNAYSARSGEWRQAWVSGIGGRLDLAGGLDDRGHMVLTETMTDQERGEVLHKISWTPQEDGTVKQHWRTSDDNGAEWADSFVGIYTRQVDSTQSMSDSSLYNGNDVGIAGPHGRLHPQSPSEADQFDFLIGEFSCNDRSRRADGAWRESKATWKAHYILNGHGIQDDYRNSAMAGTGIRVWDSQEENWRVSFYGMPGNAFGLEWKGRKEGDNMVMRRSTNNAAGTAVESVLTFSEITANGFEWESLKIPAEGDPFATWKISCTRNASDS